MSKSKPSVEETNQRELGYIADYIMELSESQQASALVAQAGEFVRKKNIELDLYEQNQRLKEMLLDAVLSNVSSDVLKPKLEKWAAAFPAARAKESQQSEALKQLHADQPLGIYRGLKERGEIAYTAWGEDLDILVALRGLMINHAKEMSEAGTYILAPVSLDTKDLLEAKLQEVAGEHPDKDLTLLIPVNSGQNHWRLAAVRLQNGVAVEAMLWDSLSNTRLQDTSAFKNLQSAVAGLSENILSVEAKAAAIQKNGYSCMDYVLQASLKVLASAGKQQLSEGQQAIIEAKAPQAIREAIVDQIVQQHAEMQSSQELQQHIQLQHVAREQMPTLAQIDAKDEDALHAALRQNKELQEDFDRLMAEKLNQIFINQPDQDEKLSIARAREFAHAALVRKYGLFSADADSIDVDESRRPSPRK